MKEIWKDIAGFPNYQVSNLGRIYSSKSNIFLRQSPTNGGYLKVCIYNEDKVKDSYVHRLVCLAFLINPKNKPTVNHINSIRDDNRLTNLEWNSYSENQKHAFRVGLQNSQGENHSRSKLTEKDVLFIRNSKNIATKDLAERFNVVEHTIRSVRARRSWKHLK